MERVIKPVEPKNILGKDFLDNANKVKDKGFQEVLLNSINKINELNQKADQAIEKLISGEIQDVHQVMIAMEKASIAFMIMMQIRNKIIEAYREIMKMQL